MLFQCSSFPAANLDDAAIRLRNCPYQQIQGPPPIIKFSADRMTGQTSSFTARRVNASTYVVQEHDAFGEIPLIYVKVHPKAPVLVITDTGCDEPKEEYKDARYIHLREYLENCPVECNGNLAFNPGRARRYIIVCTHCHYDHNLGIAQFLQGGTTEIIASAAGRDFIESDLKTNGLFELSGRPTPYYQITHWARSFERYHYAVNEGGKPVDLGMTFIQTPGHTPDSLAWYDHDEMHLYVGDSVYDAGKENMAIIWPPQGDMVEWTFSMQKLQQFVRSENARVDAAAASLDDGWVEVAKRVKMGCGHQTSTGDAEEILAKADKLWWLTIRGETPVVAKFPWLGEECHVWKFQESKWNMYFMGPARLMENVREFFQGVER